MGSVKLAFKQGGARSAKGGNRAARDYTLGDPGVYTKHNIPDGWDGRPSPVPRGGFSTVLGKGFHATGHCYPPNYLYKELSCSECSGLERVVGLAQMTAENCHIELPKACMKAAHRGWGSRLVPVSGLPQGEFVLPWALERHLYDRYPSWAELPDGRLGPVPPPPVPTPPPTPRGPLKAGCVTVDAGSHPGGGSKTVMLPAPGLVW